MSIAPRVGTAIFATSRWADGTFCNAEPAASAAAEVVVITISRVFELSPPATGPAKPAYSPWTGLTPASTAAAIPSGTLLIAGRCHVTHAGWCQPAPGSLGS